jgi:hydrogenase maturation protease
LIGYFLDTVVCFIAIGNDLKGDDGVGIYAGKTLKKKGQNVIFAHTTPEAILSKLPDDELFFIDAAHFEGDSPFLIGDPKESRISTHNYSVDLISKFIKRKVKVIGIKTYSHRFGDPVSEKAKRNADLAVGYVLGLPSKDKIH